MNTIAIRKGIIPITATVTSNSVLNMGTMYRFFHRYYDPVHIQSEPIPLVLAKLLEVSV